ncbi:hex-4 family protein [Megaselia abdita]
MHSNLFLVAWRRRLPILLIATFLILLSLWTWAIFHSTTFYSPPSANNRISSSVVKVGSSGNVGYFAKIQKLISQANKVIQRNRKQESTEGFFNFPSFDNDPGSILSTVQPAASTNVKFLKQFTKTQKRKRNYNQLPLESYLFEEERLKILQSQQQQQQQGTRQLEEDRAMEYENILSSSERQSQYEHELHKMGVPVIAGIGPGGPQPPAERLVHLDMKGAPPKLSFLKRLLPIIKTLGATGLLIEYEDMFPYTGSIQALAAKNAYEENELKDFLESAMMHGLTIMPLIQTFGHLEFALKLQGFEHLREVLDSPQSICPSRKVTMSFLEQLLTQIIEFHLKVAQEFSNKNNFAGAAGSTGGGGGGGRDGSNGSYKSFTHIHIGCDEVARMGECDDCRHYTRNKLFLSHVTSVANFIRSKWNQLNVVIWDDMLREMTLSELVESNIGHYVEPMVWVYALDIYHYISPQLWDTYAKIFHTAWAASAFKGAFGESLMLPPVPQHLENNLRWMAVIAKEGKRFSKGFRGLALTGWQRYDHFAVLCELLPASIPSLLTSLSTVSKGYFEPNPKENDILKVLECPFQLNNRHSSTVWLDLTPSIHHCQLFFTCAYPGGNVYKYVHSLFEKLTEINNYLVHVRDQSAWMSDYNVRHNFTSTLRVRDLTAHNDRFIYELTAMGRKAYVIMRDIFDEHTISELVEQKIYPLVLKLKTHSDEGQYLLQRNVWPQRPLPYTRDFGDFIEDIKKVN